MDQLRIRMYNVHFGDAFLVSVPDQDEYGAQVIRHILIDVGNSLFNEGGLDTLFAPVVDDIFAELDGRDLDLYIMTHEHMDHVQGLLYSNKYTLPGHNLAQRLNTHHTWMPISSDPKNKAASIKHQATMRTYEAIARTVAAYGNSSAPIDTLLAINDPRATADCVDYLRTLAPADKTWYVHRGIDLNGKHDFQLTHFEIWAPDENIASYFPGIQSFTMDDPESSSSEAPSTLTTPLPPHGVDAGAFYNLVDSRTGRWMDALLAIDKSVNNTSIVFCLEWRGRRLLFPGDAEIPSWTRMDENGLLEKPVDFLKISHHGSYNGTPPLDLLGKILPGAPQEERSAALSSYEEPYETIPDGATLALIEAHSKVFDIRAKPEQLYIDMYFS
jgi:beta-lactamase superfamily II metal-dependent hydrolase